MRRVLDAAPPAGPQGVSRRPGAAVRAATSSLPFFSPLTPHASSLDPCGEVRLRVWARWTIDWEAGSDVERSRSDPSRARTRWHKRAHGRASACFCACLRRRLGFAAMYECGLFRILRVGWRYVRRRETRLYIKLNATCSLTSVLVGRQPRGKSALSSLTHQYSPRPCVKADPCLCPSCSCAAVARAAVFRQVTVALKPPARSSIGICRLRA